MNSMDRGFIQLITILLLSLIIISMLGVSVSSLINNKTLRENFSLLWQALVWLWQNYLLAQAQAVWQFLRARVMSPV